MATTDGHASLGWPDAGRIDAGALADLTTIGLDSVRTAGTDDEHALEICGVRGDGGRRPPRRRRRPRRRPRRPAHVDRRRRRAADRCSHGDASSSDIGLLVTNTADGELTDAHVVIDGDRVVAVGTGRAPAADERIDAAGRCVIPGFVDSHTHLVFAGDRSAEFAARMAGAPYEAGGINVTIERHTRRDRRRAAARWPRPRLAEARRAGITTVEIKSGYGATVADEARLARLAARADAGDDVPRRPRRAGRVRRASRRLRRARRAARCWPLRPARPVDRRLLRARARSTPTSAAPCSTPAAPPGSGCACTPTSSGRAPACSSPSSSAAPRPTTARTSPTTTSRRWRRATRWPRSCRRPTSRPASRTPTPAGSSTPGRPSRWPPTATPGRATRRRCRSSSPSPCATSRMTADEAVRAATLGGARPCGATTSAGSVPAPAPTSSCSTRRAPPISSTGRACRSIHRTIVGGA